MLQVLKIAYLAIQETLLPVVFTWKLVWSAMQTAFLQEFLQMMKRRFSASKRVATNSL